jgi:hypothetical protein
MVEEMTWQYRVMRREFPLRAKRKEVVYGIHEVYTSPKGWTADPVEPHGETLEELKKDFEMMGEAFKLPVLDYKTGKKVV